MRWLIVNNVKIAVVDHNELHREFVENALMYCVNRDIGAFESTKEAFDSLNDQEVHIVLSEADMPDMDGFTLISKIKKNFPKIVCIIMSGNLSSEKKAMDCGADAFLAKPFSINDLFGIVQTFVVEGP